MKPPHPGEGGGVPAVDDASRGQRLHRIGVLVAGQVGEPSRADRQLTARGLDEPRQERRHLAAADPHRGTVRAVRTLLGLAVISELEGDLEEAIERFERSAQLARRAGCVSLVAESVAAAGVIAVRMGQIEPALANVEAIARDAQFAGYRRALATALDVAAWSAATVGDLWRAASLHARAVAVRAELGEQPRPELADALGPSYQRLRMALGDVDFDRAWASGTDADPLGALQETVTVLRSQLQLSRAGAPARARDSAPTG